MQESKTYESANVTPATGGAAAAAQAQAAAQAAANTVPQRPAHAKEYNFLDMELKYGFLQVSEWQVGSVTVPLRQH